MAETLKAVSVETSKQFNVPVERLYQAWVSEEDLKTWWHPFDNNLSEVVNELKNDGSISYKFDGDQKCVVTGKYSAVEENKKLVYSWNWDLDHDDMKNGEYILTIDFVSEGKGSRLNVKQEGFVDDASSEPHKKGWDRGLEALRKHLED